MPQQVVQLGEVRDALKSWEEVRAHILQGRIKAFAITLQGTDGKESVYMGGLYKSDPHAALKVAMRMSWQVTKAAGASG